MQIGDVIYEASDRVATITLNRPDRFNAISETMPDDIAYAFEHAGDDDSVHVVVLTGAGAAFAAATT
jgi:enoyl-CoA hydratase